MQANCLHHTNFAMSALVLGSEWLPSTLLPGSGWGIYSHNILCMHIIICSRVGYTNNNPSQRTPLSFSWLRATFIDGWQLFHHNYFLSQKMNIDMHVNNCISYLHNLSTFPLLSYLFHFYLFIYYFFACLLLPSTQTCSRRTNWSIIEFADVPMFLEYHEEARDFQPCRSWDERSGPSELAEL